MADNGFKINKSANFNPQAGTPANPVDGDFFYDSVAQSFVYYHNGSWANFDSVGSVASVLWLTGAQFTPSIVRNSVVRVTGGVLTSHLAGISASFSAKQITVYNAGTALIVVEPEDAMESTANNRIRTPTGGSMNLIAGEVAVFTYDVILNRWLLVSISSNAGAQVIATISNPGLVTLHQPSLFPLDGIVLSDGDLNTANGVVGLDANRAATIIAPLTNVTTLTLNAYVSAAASALVLQGGSTSAALQRILSDGASLAWYTAGSILIGTLHSGGVNVGQAYEYRQAGALAPDETDYIVNELNVYLGRRKLHFSDGDGFSNNFDNYMQYTTLASLGTRGIKMINETNLGFGNFEFEATGDGFGGVRADVRLINSGGTQQILSNSQGNLHINYTGVGSIINKCANGGTFSWESNSIGLWSMAGAAAGGAISSVSQNRLIRGLADPLLAHDAAHRGWVEAEVQNYFINGAFDFWQRLLSGSTSFTFNTGGATYGYTADRWYYYAVGAANSSVQQIAAPSSETDLGATWVLRSQRVAGNTSTQQRGIIQEIDRRWVRQMRGKSFTIRVRARTGTNYSGTFTIQLIIDNGGNVDQLSGVGPFYTGGSAHATSSPVPTNGGAFAEFYLNVPAIPTNVVASSIQINHNPSAGTAGADDWFDISMVQMVENTGLTGFPFRLAGDSFEGELALCQRFYERSYGPGQGLGLANQYNSQQAPITTAIGGNRHLGAVRFRAQKWESGTLLPTVTLYDMAGNASRITVNGTNNITYTMTLPGYQGFAAYTATASWTTGDLTEFHWAADGEIR